MFRPRISLKWFLLVTTLVGLLLGIYGKPWFDDWYLQRWLKRQQEIAKILTAEGCEASLSNGRVVRVKIPANLDARNLMILVGEATELENLEIFSPATDNELSLLANHSQLRVLRVYYQDERITNLSLATIGRLSRLEELAIGGANINDGGFKQLSGLAELNHLTLLSCPNVTGMGLGDLAPLKKLRWVELWQMHLRHGEGLGQLHSVDTLEIRQSRIEPDVLIHIGRMKRLKHLGFVQSTMPDESLVGLKDARQLERIHFSAASVSDKGMVHLYNLKQLQQITTAGSKVTQAGALELSEHLPNTYIVHDGPMIMPKAQR